MHYGFSTQFYDVMRRKRSWSLNTRNGFQGYAAFLSGADDPGVELGAAAGAGAAAYESQSSTAMRSIVIGVATGALTFLINHWLGKVLK